ncbi:hypothetical protein [Rhodococcus sp. A5(2022)]|uniref:hypothetical protein n=1 Tax=Rhodococcus sp. A5(2022) TaxID=3003588 RepID=UPI0022A84306|nr:hypothetical protein [Rhodococcus sp. A5(2022)]MCZ1070820.1 hypothetical protein [Rhodococcus sp. A5(2022)]
MNNYGTIPASQPVIVAAVKAGLVRYSDAATVGTKFRDGRHVRVSRIGGDGGFATDTAAFLFECYDQNEANAERLALLVDRIMKESRGGSFAGGFVTGWRRTSGPVNFEDPGTTNPRFQLTGDVTLLVA